MRVEELYFYWYVDYGFKALINGVIDKYGLTQEEIAKKLSISSVSLYKYYTGEKIPSRRLFYRIYDLFYKEDSTEDSLEPGFELEPYIKELGVEQEMLRSIERRISNLTDEHKEEIVKIIDVMLSSYEIVENKGSKYKIKYKGLINNKKD